MKKILFFLSLMMNVSLFGENIMLESAVIKIADGSLINADKIEFISKFRRKLLTILFGDLQQNNQRKGKYYFNGVFHTVESLAHIEEEIKSSLGKKDAETQLALQELLTHAKADFIVQSSEFIESGRGAKNVMIVLIEEDCKKRNRPDSFLLDWARTKEGQESTMFERQINTFGDYYAFLADLVNFLLDLTHSCSKAHAQFKERVAKWSVVKEILPVVLKKAHVKNEQINEIEFLKYLKERYLDQIAISEITPQTIIPLLAEYMKHTHNSHA